MQITTTQLNQVAELIGTTDKNITTHAGKYQVEANGHVYGIYEADTAQAARDLCAIDAGYKSEADMVPQLERPSELIATEV